METKFVLDIHRNGQFVDELATMTANNNGEVFKLTLNDVVGYIRGRKALRAEIFKDESVSFDESNVNTVLVGDKGGVYLTLTEIELYFLEKGEFAEND